MSQKQAYLKLTALFWYVVFPACTRSHDIFAPSLWHSARTAATAGTLSSSEDAGEPAEPPPMIAVGDGRLLGRWQGNTREFLGIPYAKAPVGALRFMPSEPAQAWSDTRDASAFGPACPQGKSSVAMSGPQSEDCLTLNVFTPRATPARPALPLLPVMVFIHGGAFVTGGSSSARAELLSDAGPVVVVTINYRLGALGYLSLPALDAARPGLPSGSDGIRDQQLALQWVRDHVAAFGGDANNVTVFGESAGAMSACLHLLAPGSRSLRRRVILESGVCLSGSLAGNTKPESHALSQALVDALCAGQSDALACLRAQPLEALMNWGADRTMFGAGWGPTIEGEGGVLPDTPERLLGELDDAPALIVGVNKDEWAFFELTQRDREVSSLAQLTEAIEAVFGDRAAAIAAEYPAAVDEDAAEAYVQLMTDAKLRCPARTLARLAAAHGARPYVYSFEAVPAYHSSELDFVWGSALNPLLGRGPLQSAMQSYWTRFAIEGTPRADSAPEWPAYALGSEAYMTLVNEPAASAPFGPKCDFWDNLNRSGAAVAPL